MSCGKKKVVQKTRSHRDIIYKLQKGMCRIDYKPHPDKHTSMYCTLQENTLPSNESKLYRSEKNLSLEDNNILVWAFNKNRNKTIAPNAGWVRIPLSEIDNYDFLGNGMNK